MLFGHYLMPIAFRSCDILLINKVGVSPTSVVGVFPTSVVGVSPTLL